MENRKYFILVSLVGLIVSLDQLTKTLVVANFRLGESKVIIDNFFNLTLIHNTGAAFGLLRNMDPAIREPFFLIIPLLTLGAILYAFHKLEESEIWSILGLVLIVGGAIGNLIDRVRIGYVIDFLDFHWFYKNHFPAFNVADSAICVGVFILIINLLFFAEDEPEPDKKEASASDASQN